MKPENCEQITLSRMQARSRDVRDYLEAPKRIRHSPDFNMPAIDPIIRRPNLTFCDLFSGCL